MPELYSEEDNRFRVRAWSESGRGGRSRHRIRYWYRGGEKGQDTAATAEEAVAKAEGIWKAHLDGFLEAPVTAPETFAELVEAFLRRDGLSPATLEAYGKVLARFQTHVGPNRSVHHIGRGAVTSWFAEMTCKPRSQFSYLRTLSALFKWAMREGFTRVDPTKGFRVPRFRHEIRPWLQRHEWAPFLDNCGPTHRIRAEFALHTGLRAAELMGAKWTWLHGTVGRPAISVPASKSARARAIPLDARARELLDEAKARWPEGELIFASRPTGTGNLRRETVNACRKAEVTVTDFHGLRRSAGARWLEVGASILEVSRLLGHASVTTTAKHYAGLSDAVLAAVMDKVDRADSDGAGQQEAVPRLSPARNRGGKVTLTR